MYKGLINKCCLRWMRNVMNYILFLKNFIQKKRCPSDSRFQFLWKDWMRNVMNYILFLKNFIQKKDVSLIPVFNVSGKRGKYACMIKQKQLHLMLIIFIILHGQLGKLKISLQNNM